MKRLLPIMLAFGVLLALTVCDSPKTVSISQAQAILLCSGNTGESVETTDPGLIRQITWQFNSLILEKDPSSQNSGGWELEDMAIQTGSCTNYQGFFWTATHGGIDTGFLDRLLEQEGSPAP